MKKSSAEKLKDLREEKGMSQETLAKNLHTNRQRVSTWEKYGINKLAADELMSICNYFNVSADYILGRANRISNSQANSFGELFGLSKESVEEIKKAFSVYRPIPILMDNIIQNDRVLHLLEYINAYNKFTEKYKSYVNEMHQQKLTKLEQDLLRNKISRCRHLASLYHELIFTMLEKTIYITRFITDENDEDTVDITNDKQYSALITNLQMKMIPLTDLNNDYNNLDYKI